MNKLPIIGYPNFDKFDFFKLSKHEAKQHFQEFIKLIPERVNTFSDLIFQEMLSKTWSVENPTEENLKILFEWLIKNITYQGKDGIFIKVLPLISNDSVWDSEFAYTIETKSNMTLVGIIWGEMFKNSGVNCDWSLNDKNDKDFNFNMPILVGKTKARLCPFSVLEVVCAKVMNDKYINYEEFIKTHNYWLEHY